jgi:subfamily B ATP-binding cassette protein MsbA
MKKYARIFKYISAYKGSVVLYIIFIVLSTFFSIVSIGMLSPFFELIFYGDSGTTAIVTRSDSAIVRLRPSF